MKKLGIYIHIPFCVKKCDYCDFLSMAVDETCRNKYVSALVEEISGWKDKYECGDDEYRVSTVYIGGGTPSVLEASNIEFILGKIRQY
ncbi:MAG: coproporphyrinogen III oxidase, partial [Lachnospiraceae bacterium]|nr:coproporphyrinogen III oxidase [Lachnospiraceae bacterium]